MIERIKQIIEDEQLKKNCNRPEKVYRRWFFYCYLRKQKYYLREISEIFLQASRHNYSRNQTSGIF